MITAAPTGASGGEKKKDTPDSQADGPGRPAARPGGERLLFDGLVQDGRGGRAGCPDREAGGTASGCYTSRLKPSRAATRQASAMVG